MYGCFACMHVCPCVSTVPYRVETTSSTLGLESQLLVSHHGSAGIQTQVLWKQPLLLTSEPSLQPLHFDICLPWFRSQAASVTEPQLAM